ncbi:hypothetical protein BAS10_07235 [Elizabethkingia meningoseptica]|uniref:Clp protease ClpP n=1 Tax=Elizabethkingia meningoseptica TaxID=238 RepID=UPI0009CA86D5|nr:Clp protease ClpP [Elizabethkingia meningoseptica]OPB96835.1 hypothetical protein BAS10_07235 [Elizabethkingia meningoseptica]
MNKLQIFNYHITNQNSDRLDVYIDGSIVNAETQEMLREWWNDQTSVSFKSFRTQVLESGLKNIKITINSRGGQIFDAKAMHDFIQQLENDGYNVETLGIGMVCSAATYILSASKNSKISKNAYYMIHNVSGGIAGDVNEVEKYATQLRNFNNNIRDFYADLTGKPASEIEDLMNAETWFYGQEAVDNGFVKNVVSEQTPKNIINQSDWQFKNLAPLDVYNSFVNEPADKNENLIQNIDMKKLIDGIVNAFKANNLVVTEENKAPDNLTIENLTTALTNAFEGINLDPVAPTDEQISTAISNFFKDGLPENMVNQIKEAVKPAEPAPFNLKENEDFKSFENRLGKIEGKILNGVGASQPPKNEGANYEGVSFS